ncbi:MAG: sugar ABC transporter ATP-binding protein [Actinobacteria bacterium]|nr:sugar ABC transporter ATP-binding protein [Actinomycetota bacterium]
MRSAAIEAINVSKNYGVTQALKSANFKAESGQVTALFGENGAGKSTLMKILAGIERPTSGEIKVFGEKVEIYSPIDAQSLGITIIHQELSLCPNLSVRDNIFMGRENSKLGFMNYTHEEEVTRRVLAQLEEVIDPETRVENLRLGLQQIVEIARALTINSKVLIMDEPTSALSSTEVAVLFKIILELKEKGVAIIYISHHLEEALEISDHAIVLRDGQVVAEADVADIDLEWVVSNMLGRTFKEQAHKNSGRTKGRNILEIKNARILERGIATSKLYAVEDFSLTVKAGEIVSIYGLMGAGRTELMEALAGRDDFAHGELLLDGIDVKHLSVQNRIKAGMGLVPEDRQRDGLIQQMSVGSNLSLASYMSHIKCGLVNRSTEKTKIEEAIKNVRVKTSGRDMPIESLSGGNQQKVVLGRMLLTDPKILLLDEPTRGIDVGAKGEIFDLLRERAEQGLAILFVTSEISEAINWSDRIVVMSRGHVVGIYKPSDVTREEIMSIAESTKEEGARV